MTHEDNVIHFPSKRNRPNENDLIRLVNDANRVAKDLALIIDAFNVVMGHLTREQRSLQHIAIRAQILLKETMQ